jgi:hypothetical protein
VNQQPPVQDEAIQAILGWTQNTSSSSAQGILALFSAPNFSPPTYLPPSTCVTSFSFCAQSNSKAQESLRTLKLQGVLGLGPKCNRV